MAEIPGDILSSNATRYLKAYSNENTQCRTGTSGIARSASYAAVSAIRKTQSRAFTLPITLRVPLPGHLIVVIGQSGDRDGKHVSTGASEPADDHHCCEEYDNERT